MSKHKMDVSTRRVENALVIDLKGHVDLFSSRDMRSAILDAINEGTVQRVAINLTGVSYIDSSGIASLVEGLQLARSKKCRLVLFGLQPDARKVLELARLDRVFDIRITELEALSG